MFEQLNLFESKSLCIIAGCDEAGRGPLAGPVYAACTVLPLDFPFEILNDSKKLSERKRLYAEKIIKEKAVAWSVAFSTPAEIDKINILNASLLAMERAFSTVREKLLKQNIEIQLVKVDGNKKLSIDTPCQAIVKGDASVPEIMAASILAKNERDRFMICAAKRWPVYKFEKHKGYPTKEHYEALSVYGPCPIHRMSFNLSSLH